MGNSRLNSRASIGFAIFLSCLPVTVYQGGSGYVFAQSLLSNGQWLQEYTENPIRLKFAEKNVPASSVFLPTSGTSTALPPPFLQTENPDLSSAAGITRLPAMPLLSSETAETEPSTSQNRSSEFSRNFSPWFSGGTPQRLENSPTNLDAHTGKAKEWADLEFSGVPSLLAEVEVLLASEPEAAREMYEEIEDQLQIEDRSRLKVQLLFHLDEWSLAEQLAGAFLQERPESPVSPLMYYYYNRARLAQNKPLTPNPALRERTLKKLEPQLQSDFLHILSDEALRKGELLTAIRYRLDELSNPESAPNADSEKLNKLLQQIPSLEEVQNLAENYPDLTWLQRRLPELKLELLVNLQQHRRASELLEKMVKTAREFGDEILLSRLEQMRQRFSVVLNVNPRRIGVVLPLSSSNAKIARLAQETLNGLWLALLAQKTFVPDNRSVSPLFQKNEIAENGKISDNFTDKLVPLKFDDSWELVIRDSRLNPEKTKSAIRELVETEHVIAIIGPLTRKTSEAAAEEAERLRVPLISLSLTADIPELGEYIFRNNQSWKQEIQALLEYAINERQACRFLILYAKTREGRQKMRLFWETALLKKCEVVAVEGFEVNQKSLIREFDIFTGKRQRMTPEDKEILEELEEKEVAVHNFDAIFVAVGSGGMKNLRLIFPYSAVYKMRKTIFLGDSGWNHPSLPYAPGLRGVRNPVFVDGYFRKSQTSVMQNFLRLHEQILYRHQNYTGPSDYTAYAYDSLGLLMLALKDERHHSHLDLQNALFNLPPYPGVTGNLRFDKTGEVQRKMQLLTLRKGKIQLLKKSGNRSQQADGSG